MGKHKTRNLILFTIGITILVSALGWVVYNIMDYILSDMLNMFPVPKLIGLIIVFVIIIVLLVLLGIKGNKLLKTVMGKM